MSDRLENLFEAMDIIGACDDEFNVLTPQEESGKPGQRLAIWLAQQVMAEATKRGLDSADSTFALAVVLGNVMKMNKGHPHAVRMFKRIQALFFHSAGMIDDKKLFRVVDDVDAFEVQLVEKR